MSVSPTSEGAPRNASPPGVNTSTRQTVSPLLLPAGRPDVLAHESRRPSIQFLPHTNAALPKGSPKRERGRRRISSPPPPPVFQPRVSFDTFDRPADFIEENSFTLVAKHKDYEYTKRSRTFLCGCDDNEYSDYALQWLIDELVDDGDEIVCLRVVEKDDTLAGDRSVEKGRYRSEAEALMKSIQGKNHENKAINLILEFAVGKVNKVIDEMINMYEPAILVVGTRGRSLAGFQGLLPGSVSKYCLQHSPVPVIVVRPSSKRDKARTKRALDPNRHAYKDLLEKSGSSGHLLDADPRSIHSTEDSRQVSDDEAAAVAKAIGYKPVTGTPLAQSQSVPTGEANDVAKTEDLDVAAALMKSPELQNLDSPEVTDASSSSDDEGGVPTGATTTTKALAESSGSSEDIGDTADGAASGLGIQPAAESAKEPVAEPEDKHAAESAEESARKNDGDPTAETATTSTVDPNGNPADAPKSMEGA